MNFDPIIVIIGLSEHRPLGRTGVSVSKPCLGTMMFGEWGTKDHDESVRIIHRALDRGRERFVTEQPT